MRYSRQLALDVIGKKGQDKLNKSSITIIGCGTLGTNSAELLSRAGVGNIFIIDNEKIELSNLQRQSLFTEKDIGKYKVDTAKKRLKEINSKINIKTSKDYLNNKNINRLIKKTDLILDCVDNLETRFLINDFAKKNKIIWIHAAAIKTKGFMFNILPGKACLTCFMKKTNDTERCEDVGVLNTITNIISSLQTTQTIKILLNKNPENDLIRFDAWENKFEKIKVNKNKKCDACNGKYKFLEKKTDFYVKHCKTKAAFSAKPKTRMNLDLNKIKNKFKTKLESSILLILDVEGGIIVHKYGELIFKKLNNEKKVKEISEKIYSIGR
ncbi:HesA/MoeB/ThiF family protein [Candidatus Woesearchaeota archaeon]|nr:HesA/MoeB/ThiF family protein [Candidatus Woesearchaeota archaeon]